MDLPRRAFDLWLQVDSLDNQARSASSRMETKAIRLAYQDALAALYAVVKQLDASQFRAYTELIRVHMREPPVSGG